jgi:hypothetical protein
MGRLYSNVNDRFRRSNLARVTDQQLRPFSSPRMDVVEANQTLAQMDEAVQDHHTKSLMRELLRIRPIMEARPDKRRRPQEVSKKLFVAYRKYKIGFRKRSIRKKKKQAGTN